MSAQYYLAGLHAHNWPFAYKPSTYVPIASDIMFYFSGNEKLNLEEQMGAIYKLVHTVNRFNVSLQALSLLYQVSTAR